MGNIDDVLQRKRKAPSPAERICERHLEDLRRSGLSDEAILCAGFCCADRDTAAGYLGLDPGDEVLVMPYPGCDGFYRFRRGHHGADEAKYLQRQGSGNRLYVPVDVLNGGVLKDPSRPLIVTEGEKKALKATQEGFPTVGLGGVWSWRTRDEDRQSHPIDDLNIVAWSGRTAYIAFDSDAETNRDVRAAEEALSAEFRDRGARVLFVRLPEAAGQKVGLDDYLVANGADALRGLLEGALPPPTAYFNSGHFRPARVASELKARDLYLHAIDPESGNGPLLIWNGRRFAPAFDLPRSVSELLGDRLQASMPEQIHTVMDADPELVVPNDGMDRPREFDGESHPLINLRNGLLDPFTEEFLPHDPTWRCTREHPVDWNPDANTAELEELLETILGEWRATFEEWAGYLLVPLQYVKGFALFIGPTNTGKSTAINLLQAMLGDGNYATVDPQTLCDNRFGLAEIEGKLCNFHDDISGQYLKNPSVLKILTGGTPTIRIEHKHRSAYNAPNVCRAVFAGNEVPTSADKTEAWYQRMIILPFGHVFDGEEADAGFRRRASTDPGLREAMLLLAVRGLQRLGERRWQIQGDQEALGNYRTLNDPVQAFLTECCEADDDAQEDRTLVSEAYGLWCHDADIRPGSAMKLYERITQDPRFSHYRHKTGRFLKGLKLTGTWKGRAERTRAERS